MWLAVDPMLDKYPGVSPYNYVMNSPVNVVDPNGMDTLDISKNARGIWEITRTQIVKGDDVFRVNDDGKTTSYTFSEGEYGKRVNMLNLENTDEYTLGAYHISGEEMELGRSGFFVTPGGEASTKVGSNKRLPADVYDLQSSPESAAWRQVWVTHGASNGDVSARGVKFHFGGLIPADWTQGCFVISSRYTMVGNSIRFNQNESRAATVLMDFHLGAQSIFIYDNHRYGGAGRIGASFGKTNLDHKLVLKDGF